MNPTDICESRRWCEACRRDARFREHLGLPEACPYGVTVEIAAKQPVPPYPTAVIPATPAGPGAELTKLLAKFGITHRPECKCADMAAKMDRWGPDECSKPERVNEVLAVMRAEAQKRGLPFVDAAGRLLIKRAIKNAQTRK